MYRTNHQSPKQTKRVQTCLQIQRIERLYKLLSNYKGLQLRISPDTGAFTIWANRVLIHQGNLNEAVDVCFIDQKLKANAGAIALGL